MAYLTEFILIAFATYYFTFVFTYERGPFNLFDHIKVLAGVQVWYLIDQKTYEWARMDNPQLAWDALQSERDMTEWRDNGSFISGVLACRRCFAPYAALLLALTYWVFPPIVLVLAAAGLALYMLER